MSTDKTLLAIEKVTYKEYHSLILELVRAQNSELVQYIQPNMTKGIHDDPERQKYPVRVTVNEVMSQAAQLRRAAESKELTGWLLPGCDIPRIRGDATNIPGWRPNMVVTQIDGVKLNRPQVLSLTLWGERAPIWIDSDKARNDQRRIPLPLFRPVTVVAGEKEFDTRQHGKKKSWDLLFIKAIHGTKPIEMKTLINLLLTSSEVITPENLSTNQVFSTVVLKGTRWIHAESIDEWVDDPQKVKKIAIKGPDGQQLYAPDPISGRPVPQWEEKPQRSKSEIGQPFMQDVIGSKPEEGRQTATMKVMLGPKDEDTESNQRIRVELQNYRYGKPELYIFGLGPVLLSAVERGNFVDPDPTKNPYALLNDSYRGTELVVVANYSKANKYRGQDNKERLYCTLIGGLIMFKDAHTLDPSDCIIPVFPNEIPPEMIDGAHPVESTPVVVADAPEVHVPVVDSSPVVVATPSVDSGPVVVDDGSRKAELEKMKFTDLKKILAAYREDGFEVVLRGNQASIINQILQIEEGEVTPADQVMEEHKESVKAAEEDTQFTKPDISEGKAKLLAKKKSQREATAELTVTEDAPDEEVKDLELRITDVLSDIPDEETTFEDLWGQNNNMGILPKWVTPNHKVMIEAMIERIQKQLQA